MCRILRAAAATTFAGAIVVSASLAQAGVGQCYDRQGRAIGPTYNTDHPNASFHKWVARRGGSCRRIGGSYFGSNKRPYPPAYLNPQSARAFPRHRNNPCGRAQLAGLRPSIHPRDAVRLVERSYRRQGYGWVRVRDTGLVIYIRGRLWQYLRVRTSDGTRHKVALREGRGGRFVILENSGHGWDGKRVVRN
ncbi:MAG: hypothetical protein OEQ29_07120 [Alphaproteobacteria bacterium]|nr:hypothetical protein [Alphaproteobacteria bacterium]